MGKSSSLIGGTDFILHLLESSITISTKNMATIFDRQPLTFLTFTCSATIIMSNFATDNFTSLSIIYDYSN
jgi:hypothetical protein